MSPTDVTSPPLHRRITATLGAPVDPASLAVLRVLFGVLIAVGSWRFLASGFLGKLYCEDAFYFRYWGFTWVPVPSPTVIAGLYATFIALGVLIALGLFFRFAMGAFTLLFLWVQLVDVTNYLNHYLLVILLGAWLTLSPANAALSLDARWFGAARSSIPFFFVAALRFQVGVVYVFASLAKAGPDWLFHGQPLGLWLPVRDSIPLIGPLLTLPFVPLVLSWCGFVYDASIVPLLLTRRTRWLGYALVVVFHSLTRAFFEIGMFPFIMIISTTVFFHPSWPRRLLPAALQAHDLSRRGPAARPVPRAALVLASVWVTFSVLFPLRFAVLGDNVLWDEAGMRFSWRVMVREKSGTLTYLATLPNGRVLHYSPHDFLSHRQVNEMIGQPDMILQLAHHIRDLHAVKGERVTVHADARVSLNGRALSRFIDPTVDLALAEDSFGRAPFVLPAPREPPRSAR